ncbi:MULTISPECIES: hypothetical protein [Pseudoalteromonas]|uniref:Class I lanthipeptide n=1 Tax=Pseudoalteromonas obscura TaxID=3048491 RepID=A0ABT7EI45_9GAMM|nr:MULTISPECIES: hypothetical protein [Pseudoalteromonas]MBQ4836344.1 hypothetical protein [Pseudoalteromonas luteoviolacea]MDK2594694.1 hypothetical protein [Pseudoalteromonas sp. P94(2023)]
MKLTIKKTPLKKLSSDKALQPNATNFVAGGEPDLCPTVGQGTCINAIHNSGCFTAREQDCPVAS